MGKDYHDELRAYARRCTTTLSDDAELCQQVEYELLDHLETAFEEERKTATEEEALSIAMRRFGNPEELNRQLAESNAKRLSRHARIRRAIRWMLLPLLLLAVLLCLDLRGILSSTMLLKWFTSENKEMRWEKGLKTRRLSEREQLLFDYHYDRGNGIDSLSHLYETNRNDAMICAIFALELSQRRDDPLPETKSILPEVIANGRRIDPNNPLYDLLDSFRIMKEACELPRVYDTPAGEEALVDRGKMDEAIALYERALGKGEIRTYSPELLKSVLGMLKIKEDLLGGMHLIDLNSRERILLIPPVRNIVRGVVLYCDLLQKEGENAKAIALLATWHTFLQKYINGDNTHFLDILVGISLANDFLKCAKRLGATEQIASLQALLDMRKELDQDLKDESHRREKTAGSFLNVLAMPYASSGEGYNMDEWSIEGKLERATFATLSLALACCALLGIIVFFGLHALVMRLCGHHPFLFILPKSAYIRLILIGILLPALLFLGLSHYLPEIQFALQFALKMALWVLQAIYLCLLWPCFYGIYSNRVLKGWMNSIGAKGNKAFQASLSLNLLCLFAMLFIGIGCILRPVSAWQQLHYLRRETLVIPKEGVDYREKRVIRHWKARFLELCANRT